MMILYCYLPAGSDGIALHGAGLALLRRGLKLLGRPFSEPLVADGGKPFLPGGPEFNISHSGLMTVCALSDAPVGVDVEQVSRVSEELLRVFSPDERRFVLSAPEADRRRRFFTVWCVKESVVKASGQGIGAIPGMESAVTPALRLSGRVEGFHVRALPLPAPYVGAVACALPEEPEIFETPIAPA